MPSKETLEYLDKLFPDRITAAETYAIAVINRTPEVEKKDVFSRFARQVFGDDQESVRKVARFTGMG